MFMATIHSYRPLNVSQNEIRIVLLAPSYSSKAAISCTLLHRSLDQNPPFEALSYTWGDKESRGPILLDGQEFLVTKNLEIALRNLRYVRDERRLWIDALCINQDDIDERNQQVPLMGLIYQKAAKVVAWIGLASHESNIGIDFLREASVNRSNIHAWLTTARAKPGNGRKWSAVADLLERDYWKRVWIVQEIFFGTSVIVRCGSCCIRWSDFALVFFTMGDLNAPPDAHLQSTNVLRAGDFLEIGRSLLRIVNTLTAPASIERWRRRRADPTERDHVSFIMLLVALRDCLSTDPRDKVFGITAMADQYQDHRALNVDYRKSTRNVYIDTVRVYFERRSDFSPGCLNIICSSIPYLSDGSLPSWVPDWSSPVNQLAGLGPGQETYIFKANGDSPPEATMNIESDVLQVSGLEIATISLLGEIPDYTSRIRTKDSLDFVKSSIEDSISTASVFFAARKLALSTSANSPHRCKPLEARKEQFARTIILNHGLRVLDEESRQLSKETAQNLCREVIDQIAEGSWLSLHMPTMTDSVIQGLLSKVIIYLRHYRFCVSSDGTFVMSQPSARVGDVIFVMFGCDMPVLLRKSSDGYYTFVGECYAHGIMYGEAIDGMRAGKYEAKDIRLR